MTSPGDKTFTRIPPSSTGNRIHLRPFAMVPYTGRVGSFAKDDHVHLVSSGIQLHVHSIQETGLSTGYLIGDYDRDAVFNNVTPTAGETITDHDGVTIAFVSNTEAARDVHVPTQHIVSHDNPEYGLNVDRFGSAQVTFSEGKPQLDAFGKLRVSQGTLIGEYVFANSYMPDAFSSRLVGSGTIGWDQNKRAALLSSSTASGDIVAHTSNTYHHYVPGSSQLFMATVALGDAGKANLGRSWGLFDFQNGAHFVHREDPLSPGQIKLGCVIKSDVTGTVVDKYFWQSDWNVDPLDGTGRSGMTIDVTKDNLYWIDMQWLGAGRVRFGVFYNGQRITCHEYYHGNTEPYSFSATGSLPVCFSQRNFGVTASSSEMRVFCSAVWTESQIDLKTLGKPGLQIVYAEMASNDQYVYAGTLAPKELNSNGRVNRTLYFPTELEVFAYDTVNGVPAMVEVEIRAEPVVSGIQWQDSESSATVVYDSSGTFHGGGMPIVKTFASGRTHEDLGNIFNNMQSGAMKNYAESGGTVTQTITGITQAATAVMTVSGSQLRFRQGGSITISGVGGMTQVNGQTYYVKPVGLNTAELYTDAGLTTPVNSSTFGAYTSGGEAKGMFGTQFLWGVFVKKLYGTHTTRVAVKTGWKEISQ